MTILLVALGVLAGALTSLAGQGGGVFLVVACSLFAGPHEALAMTAPALVLGNLHRALLFRRAIDRPVALRIIAGALPGGLAGAFFAGHLPSAVLEVALVAVTALAIAKAFGLVRFAVPRGALFPSGLAIGAMTGPAGGAGVLLSPVLLSSGLTGAPYVGTMSAIGVAVNLGRVAGYRTAGLFAPGGHEILAGAATLALSIFAGNLLATRQRSRLSMTALRRIELWTLVACAAIAVVGLHG